MLNVLWILLGVLLAIVVVAVIVVLCVNLRVQQLKDEKYSNQERFAFISWIISWATPLLFNVKVNIKGLEKLDQVEHGVIYANHQSNIDTITMLLSLIHI